MDDREFEAELAARRRGLLQIHDGATSEGLTTAQSRSKIPEIPANKSSPARIMSGNLPEL